MQKNKTNNNGRLYILHNRAIFPITEKEKIKSWSELETYSPNLPSSPSGYSVLVSDMSTFPVGLGDHPSGDTEFEILSAAKVALVSNSIAQATTNDLEPKWQGPSMMIIGGLSVLVVLAILLIILVTTF